MKLALLAHKQSEEWQRGIGIPYFVRWLRHRRWEDEIVPRPAASADGRIVDVPAEVAQW